MTRGMLWLFAFSCGAIVANIYYAQPIIGLIAPELHMQSDKASLIVSVTQIGYAFGLFFFVPLGDLLENRKLTLALLSLSALGLAASAMATSANLFLLFSLLIGIGSVAVQILIPFAAHLAHETRRGRVVGNIMSGLLLGILLARPIASLIADRLGWRAVFGGAAGFMLMVGMLLAFTLPPRRPEHKAGYGQLLASLGHLLLRYPLLRQRALYQACMFASFSLFWTAAPLELARHYHLTQTQIALFALVGATGAIAAPISGRLADAGHTRAATLFALCGATLLFAPEIIPAHIGIIGLALSGVALDFCVQMNMVLGQRTIYALDPISRGRLNGLYMTSIFLGGAIGSAAASSLYTAYGWPGIAAAAGAFPLLALLRFLSARDQA